jgi:hypothetical protein
VTVKVLKKGRVLLRGYAATVARGQLRAHVEAQQRKPGQMVDDPELATAIAIAETRS